MYFAHQVAHVPLEAPPNSKFAAACSKVTDPKRNVYCRMLAALDDSLQRVISQFKAKGMWDDTLLIVTTDNGGIPDVANVFPASAGSNWPLRAGKGTVFEGGVRGQAFVNGGKNVVPSDKRGTRVSRPLLHVTDWFPTIAAFANAPGVPSDVDGINLLPMLFKNQTQSVHASLPLNINYDIGYPNSGHQVSILAEDGWKLLDFAIGGPVLNYDGWFGYLNHGYGAPFNQSAPPNATPGKFLFNVLHDPEERNNLYSKNTAQLARLQNILKQYMKDYSKPQDNKFHWDGLPELHNGMWAPFYPALRK